MKKAFIGLDPGKSGFITLFKDDKTIFYPMPTHKVETGEKSKKGKIEATTEFHEAGLIDLAVEIRKEIKDYELFAGIEEVTGRQGWSASNNFNFGYIAGMQKMLLILLNANISSIRPQKWQSVIYKGYDKVMIKSKSGKTMIHDTKATSELVSKKIAPQIIFSRQGVLKKDGTSHKVDDNKTDSFLICEYMRRMFGDNKK